MSELKRTRLKQIFHFSLKDTLVAVLIMAVTLIICYILNIFDDNKTFDSMLFILAVFLISRFTEGYFYGIFAAVTSVFAVNFLFTYPYYAFNFTLAGYPLTMLCMLVVAIITSMLTTQIKRHSYFRIEAEKEKTRSNLLRAISHDLRTPLTSILGASSAIIENDDKLDQKTRIKLLTEINDDAQWLIRMVENLLSITRMDNGNDNTRIAKRPEMAEELIAVSVTKFKNRFPDRTVSVEVPDQLLLIPMDAMLIEQVIINLLENSVLHAVSATKLQLIVSVEENNAVFEVIDDGVGIPEKILPHIFDGYFKHSYEEECDTKKNMGIGLSVCYTIVKAHNGTMTAYNKAGGGAVFRFTLPIEEEKP